MSSNTRKDAILNSAVLLAAWLVLIAMCIDEDVESTPHVARAPYQAP
jgi:hypothetical protein